MAQPDAASPAPSAARHRSMRPRDAGSLVILDRSLGRIRILFGKRSSRQVFVPSKYVFPGGGLDPRDLRQRIPSDLDPVEQRRLLQAMRGRPSLNRARGLALAAVRETFEETGLVLGKAVTQPIAASGPEWESFLAHGRRPPIEDMIFLARAITPPGRTRRYDARFFCVSADAIAHDTGERDGEFVDLVWATLEEARRLDLHSMTRTVVDDLADRLNGTLELDRLAPVPFYHSHQGSFRREFIT